MFNPNGGLMLAIVREAQRMYQWLDTTDKDPKAIPWTWTGLGVGDPGVTNAGEPGGTAPRNNKAPFPGFFDGAPNDLPFAASVTTTQERTLYFTLNQLDWPATDSTKAVHSPRPLQLKLGRNVTIYERPTITRVGVYREQIRHGIDVLLAKRAPSQVDPKSTQAKAEEVRAEVEKEVRADVEKEVRAEVEKEMKAKMMEKAQEVGKMVAKAELRVGEAEGRALAADARAREAEQQAGEAKVQAEDAQVTAEKLMEELDGLKAKMEKEAHERAAAGDGLPVLPNRQDPDTGKEDTGGWGVFYHSKMLANQSTFVIMIDPVPELGEEADVAGGADQNEMDLYQ